MMSTLKLASAIKSERRGELQIAYLKSTAICEARK